MNNKIAVLTCALDYIENHLCGEMSPQEVADACHYSLSGLQKIFGHVFHIGLADYMARRRVTLAARELVMTRDSIVDIALRYGYGSHEVFIRAFRRIWGETPSHFRRTRTFTDIYPPNSNLQGGSDMIRHHFDVTQLYDAICQREGTWAIIFDTRRLMEINDTLGRGAGDLAIAECLRRIDCGKREDMLMFRIGGDEFILLTGLTSEKEAKELALSILAHNGETVPWENQALPVSMHHALARLDSAETFRSADQVRELVDSAKWTFSM